MKKQEKKLKDRISDAGLGISDAQEGNTKGHMEEAFKCTNSCTAKAACDSPGGWVNKCPIMCNTCYISV